MMVAPGKTPRDVVERLHAELTGILTLSEINTHIFKLGMLSANNLSVDGLQSFVRAEIVRWGKIVQQAGIAGLE